MRASYSAISLFRRCQQAYRYAYVDNLSPRVEAAAPTLGSMLHKYCELYYGSKDADASPMALHADAQDGMMKEYEPLLLQLAELAASLASEEKAIALRELPSKALAISDRYFVNRGKADKTKYEVLHVEHKFDIIAGPGIAIPAVIDMVTRDDVGNISVWEHKTTTSVPTTSYRIRDLQTLLYASLVHEIFGYDVRSVTWNYMRTKMPTAVHTISGRKKNDPRQLSRDKGLDTTWYMYERACIENGFDAADYADVRERLFNREIEVWFPRYEMALLADPNIILRDMMQTARHAQRFEQHVAADPNFISVRSISRECDWCQFAPLCDAAITGGDETGTRQRLFAVRQRKEDLRDSGDADDDINQLFTSVYGGDASN